MTPVRMGPLPMLRVPLPLMIVSWPTKTPETSVIALSPPGVPSKGMPSDLARTGSAEWIANVRTVQSEKAISVERNIGFNFRGGVFTCELIGLPSLGMCALGVVRRIPLGGDLIFCLKRAGPKEDSVKKENDARSHGLWRFDSLVTGTLESYCESASFSASGSDGGMVSQSEAVSSISKC